MVDLNFPPELGQYQQNFDQSKMSTIINFFGHLIVIYEVAYTKNELTNPTLPYVLSYVYTSTLYIGKTTKKLFTYIQSLRFVVVVVIVVIIGKENSFSFCIKLVWCAPYYTVLCI